MISPELIRRYPFFAGLNHDYTFTLANCAVEHSVEAGHCFIQEGDELNKFYLVLQGAVAIMIDVTDRGVAQPLYGQLTGHPNTMGVTVSSVGPGEMFGWSALVPPHKSTASAKAMTSCRVAAFDMEELRPILEKDCRFAYLMLLKAAQVVRGRLRDRRIESLAENMA